MRRALIGIVFALVANPPGVSAQVFGFTDAFKPEEFAARRANVMAKIGGDVAVVLGSAESASSLSFRQNTQFFYLTGVEVRRAVLVIDGKARSSTLFIAPPGSVAELDEPTLRADTATRRITGIERVLPRDSVIPVLTRLAREGRAFYAPYRSESRNGIAQYSQRFDAENLADPFDRRISRERVLLERLRELAGNDAQDLDPILDRLRSVRSPAEIAVLREAARLAALGMMAVMRSASPGMYEYQLVAVADFEFRYHDAMRPAYYALSTNGTGSQWGYHSARNQLGPNDLVLFDYAPVYKYYQADVARMFPANGKFTARQRELYAIYLRLYRAMETSLKPGVPLRSLLRDTMGTMDKIVAEFHFTDPRIKAAALELVNQARNSRGGFVGHTIGMEIGEPPMPGEVLRPGMTLTIESSMLLPDENLRLRLQNVYLITATGYENLSSIAPVEPDAIEKLMREDGLVRYHKDASR